MGLTSRQKIELGLGLAVFITDVKYLGTIKNKTTNYKKAYKFGLEINNNCYVVIHKKSKAKKFPEWTEQNSRSIKNILGFLIEQQAINHTIFNNLPKKTKRVSFHLLFS